MRRAPPLSAEAAAAIAEIDFPVIDSHHHIWEAETQPRRLTRFVGLDWRKHGVEPPANATPLTGKPRHPKAVLFKDDEEAKAAVDALVAAGTPLTTLGDYNWPDLQRDFAEAGVDVAGTVYLEASWTDRSYRAGETEWLQQVAAETGNRVGTGIQGYADMQLSPADFEKEIREHMRFGNFRGIRWRPHDPDKDWLFHTFDEDPSYLDQPNVRENFKTLGKLGLVFDLWYIMRPHNMEKIAASVAEIMRDSPGLTMVLDHFGTPFHVFEDAECFERWKSCMRSFEKIPGFYCKVSGLMEQLGVHYDKHPRSSGPFASELARNRFGDLVRFTLGLFGTERCLFGSNFPVDGFCASYGELVGAYWIAGGGWIPRASTPLAAGPVFARHRAIASLHPTLPPPLFAMPLPAPDKLLPVAAAAAGAVLLPRFPALYRAAKGRRAFALLAAATAAAGAYKAYRARRAEKEKAKGGRLAEDDGEWEPGLRFYALCAAAALALASRRRAPTLDRFLAPFVALAAAPAIAEFLSGGDADVPACLAIALGLLMGHHRAAAVILLMITGGEALEHVAMDRAGTALQTLLVENPGLARLESGEDVPAESVKPGDVFVVRANESVAVDGTLLDDGAAIDEALITGEPAPAPKRQGDSVYAGTVNRGARAVRVRADKPYADSVFQQMRTTLGTALERKSDVELNSKRIADGLTPLTLAAAAVGYLLALRRGTPPVEAWDTVLSVLMSATPCPAAIGVPVAMLSGMSLASRRLGSTVKSGDALEALADARCVVFDKTGTLTFGTPEVVAVHCEPEGRRDEALGMVAGLERLSKHVLADAVFRHARDSGAMPDPVPSVEDFSEESGLGVSGTVGGFRVKVGAPDFCGVPAPGGADDTLRACFLIVAPDGAEHARGTVAFRDPVRPSAVRLVAKLRASGAHVAVLSGDRSAHLASVAKQLGADEWHACLPHEKAAMVETYRNKWGAVAFVGDGANDAAALAAADVGISVDPSSLSSEPADVVVMNGDVSRVHDLAALSRRVVRIARRTVRWGTAASACQMVLAAGGWTGPLWNAVAQECVDLASVLHSMTAMGWW
ncbi:hypothetical protein DFJ74DRAFT_760380 [Hyaloraphidium curvatum]|nr:hypothetical protein DFJ74DRAFT_760380 [Hyaloraphidium curvatum]